MGWGDYLIMAGVGVAVALLVRKPVDDAADEIADWSDPTLPRFTFRDRSFGEMVEDDGFITFTTTGPALQRAACGCCSEAQPAPGVNAERDSRCRAPAKAGNAASAAIFGCKSPDHGGSFYGR